MVVSDRYPVSPRMFPLDFVRHSLKCFAVVIMKAEGHCPVMPEKAREALNFLSGVAGWKCHPAGNNFFTTICDLDSQKFFVTIYFY